MSGFAGTNQTGMCLIMGSSCTNIVFVLNEMTITERD